MLPIFLSGTSAGLPLCARGKLGLPPRVRGSACASARVPAGKTGSAVSGIVGVVVDLDADATGRQHALLVF